MNKTLVAALEFIALFVMETVLWILGVKPGDIEMEEEWP